MVFKEMKQYYSVLTNGETELEIYCGRFGGYIDPGEHVFGQDGFGNSYIDGKPAQIEVRVRCVNCNLNFF